MFIEKRYNHIGFSVTPPLLVLRKRFKSSGSGTSATPTIDYTALGKQQLDANLTTGAQTAGLNNVNTTSPIWSSTYEPFGTGANGIGPAGYNLKQTLSDAAQKQYNAQTTTATGAANNAQYLLDPAVNVASQGSNMMGYAQDKLGTALPVGGLDFSGLAPIASSPSDFSKETKDAEDASYNTSTRYLDPKYKGRDSDFKQQMADQGISIGSDAYDRGYGDLAREKSFDYGQASDSAVTAGQKEQNTLYNQSLASRGQGVAEKEAQYTYPVTAYDNLINTGASTFGSGVTGLDNIGSLGNTAWATAAPSAATGYGIPSTNVVGAANAANTSNANAFTSGKALNDQLFNGLGTLGGSSTLWGTNGLSGALGLGGSSTGLLGSLFGGSSAGAAGLDAAMGAAGAGDFASMLPFALAL